MYNEIGLNLLLITLILDMKDPLDKEIRIHSNRVLEITYVPTHETSWIL